MENEMSLFVARSSTVRCGLGSKGLNFGKVGAAIRAVVLQYLTQPAIIVGVASENSPLDEHPASEGARVGRLRGQRAVAWGAGWIIVLVNY